MCYCFCFAFGAKTELYSFVNVILARVWHFCINFVYKLRKLIITLNFRGRTVMIWLSSPPVSATTIDLACNVKINKIKIFFDSFIFIDVFILFITVLYQIQNRDKCV